MWRWKGYYEFLDNQADFKGCKEWVNNVLCKKKCVVNIMVVSSENPSFLTVSNQLPDAPPRCC